MLVTVNSPYCLTPLTLREAAVSSSLYWPSQGASPYGWSVPQPSLL